MRAALVAQSMAQTSFTVKARDGRARCGVLVTKNGSIETPAVLLYTRRGGPLSLTSPDMLAAVTPPVQGAQISVMQFLEHPDASIVREHGGGAHGFLCLGGYPVLASNRDPTMYEFGSRPSTDKELHVSIHSGGHMVSPERYMQTVAALKPDLYVTLCDEIPADARLKRVGTSVKRTTAWLDACLQLHSQYQQQQQPEQQQQAAEGKKQHRGGSGKQARGGSTGQARGSGGVQEEAVAASGDDVDAPQEQQQQQQAEQREEGRAAASCGGCGAGPASGSAGGGSGVAAGAEEARGGEGAGPSCGAAGGGGGGGEGGPLAGSILLAALTGGSLPAERARAATAVADKDGVGGYAVCGLGTGEPPEQRPALITASLDALPAGSLERRPVFASGLVGSPEELLEAVAAGVDLLDCAYVAQVTAGGYALTFPLRPPPGWQPITPQDGTDGAAAASSTALAHGEVSASVSGAAAAAAPAAAAAAASSAPSGPDGLGPDVSSGADDTKINLWSSAYRLDKSPLLPGCGCFTCRRHSRAYAHHLLNTHEMLGDVLLEAHNTSHLMAFCQSIREAISEGRLETFRAWFRSLRAAPLVTAPHRVTAKRRASDSVAAEAAAAETAAAGEAAGAVHGSPKQDGIATAVRSKWVRV